MQKNVVQLINQITKAEMRNSVLIILAFLLSNLLHADDFIKVCDDDDEERFICVDYEREQADRWFWFSHDCDVKQQCDFSHRKLVQQFSEILSGGNEQFGINLWFETESKLVWNMLRLNKDSGPVISLFNIPLSSEDRFLQNGTVQRQLFDDFSRIDPRYIQGLINNNLEEGYFSWMWKAAPAYMAIFLSGAVATLFSIYFLINLSDKKQR